MRRPEDTAVAETLDFDGLTIRFDEQVLRPRPWTAQQSRWAAELLERLPEGSVLELCAGAGQIGLAAVARSGRRLVCVDAAAVACRYAAHNAREAGMAERVEVREAPLAGALAAGEQFVLVVADPPWVESGATGTFPKDPLTAIDGGTDGLDVARECLAVVGAHLAPGGTALLQLGTVDQAEALSPEIGDAGLRTVEVRRYAGGVVVRLDRAGG